MSGYIEDYGDYEDDYEQDEESMNHHIEESYKTGSGEFLQKKVNFYPKNC